MDERARRELATTRKLYVVWGICGILVVLALCYLVYAMLRARAPVPLTVGAASDFAADSVTLKYMNAVFSDPVTQKEFTTLSLDVERDSSGNFTVFFARSTDPVLGGLTPRQCVIEWSDSLKLFVEPCGGSQWARDGKYVSGPAPRDLDRFPAQVENGDLTIQLDLVMGEPHP